MKNSLKVIILGLANLVCQEAQSAMPKDWQIYLQPAATPVMEKLHELYFLLLLVSIFILLVVLGLLGYVCFRYRASRNPKPAKFTHNAKLEAIWTIIPCIILVAIAIPSFRTIYYMDKVVEPEMTLKIVGNQWFWHYEYPDQGFEFDSFMLEGSELNNDDLRLLEVDNRVVLPVDTNIKLLLTSADVIHSWTVPAFGIKKDSVPGRVNETWLNIKKPGVYYGQCSELCGTNHGFMPIAVEVVSKQEFKEWLKTAKKKYSN